jgi:tetratricopeptide (TPR) repeat protein
MFLLTFDVFTQNLWTNVDSVTLEILKQYDSLIAVDKYSTAYSFLTTYEENEFILAKKIDILLKNSLENYLYRYYLLVDEDRIFYKNKQVIIFDPIEEINNFKKTHGVSGILEYYAGFYYYELRGYGIVHGEWLMPEKEIIQNIIVHYNTAFLMGFYDIDAYQHYALANRESGNYTESREYYKRVVELQEKDNYFNYNNLSYAYYFECDYNNAINNIKKTIEIFKSDAFYCFLEYKMLAFIYSKIGMFEQAIECIDEMKILKKMSYYNSDDTIFLAENYLYLSMDDKIKTMETGKEYFDYQINYIIEGFDKYHEVVMENAIDAFRVLKDNYIETNNIDDYLLLCEYYLEKYNENEIIGELIRNIK